MSLSLPSTTSILLAGPGPGGGQPEKKAQSLAESFAQSDLWLLYRSIPLLRMDGLATLTCVREKWAQPVEYCRKMEMSLLTTAPLGISRRRDASK